MRKIIIISGVVLVTCLVGCLVAISILRWQANIVTSENFTLEQSWEYRAEDNVESIVLGLDSLIVLRTVDSILVLDATEGQPVWSAPLPRTFGGGAPVISNNTIVVAHSKGVNAYNLQTGQRLWQNSENAGRGHQTFAASANNDVVVVVGGYITIHDLKTGDLLWQIERAIPGLGALAIIDGNNLYVIFLNQIRNYDITNGQLLWSVKTPLWSLRSMLYEDKVLYLETSLENGVGAFDVETRKTLWEQKGQFETFSQPIRKYGNDVFVAVEGTGPIALDARTGEIKWQAKGLPEDVYLTPLLTDNIVYTKSLYERKLYALDFQNREIIGALNLGWPKVLPSARSTSVGPFLLDTKVVFADDSRVFAYEK